MKNLNVLLFLFSFAIFISCSNDEGIAEVNLNGTVLGASFEAAGGNAFEVGNNLLVTISSEEANCSSTITSHSAYLFFEVPNGTGPYIDVSLTYAGNGENSIEYSSATVIITAIKENTVSGQIIANFNADNSVEGNFVVAYCE